MSTTKIIAIGGEPAVGKTTLIRKFFSNYSPWYQFKYKKLYGHFNKELHLVILGVYSAKEVFSGTDRLSMSVQPDFEEFIDKNKPNYNILFEGDRLFNLKSIKKAESCMDLKVYILESDFIDSRHKDRNDNQSEKFIKGRRTKVKNIKEYLKENFTVLKNNTENDLNKNYNVLCNNLIGG
jgi:GTPase SAR1 family protein